MKVMTAGVIDGHWPPVGVGLGLGFVGCVGGRRGVVQICQGFHQLLA